IRRSSRSRRRSTARPRRAFRAPMMAPSAVSMNTGAIASWMTSAICGTCGSTAMRTSLRRAPRSRRAGACRTSAGRRGIRAGPLLLLLLGLLLRLLVALLPGGGVSARGDDRRRGGDSTDDQDLRVQPAAERLGLPQHARVDDEELVVPVAADRE